MKSLLAFIMALVGCTAEREIQADMVDATLVNIEVRNRYPDITEKVLTWRTSNKITYVTFEPAHTDLAIGTLRKVLVQK